MTAQLLANGFKALCFCLLSQTDFHAHTLPDTVIDSIVVYKSRHQLLAFSGDGLFKTCSVALGRNPKGHKQQEGDDRTPEGKYRITLKNPKSFYYKSLAISYPNKKDVAAARKKGKDPGGSIVIHGFPEGIDTKAGLPTWGDWTYGCIAITNEDLDSLFEKVAVGAVIIIYP